MIVIMVVHDDGDFGDDTYSGDETNAVKVMKGDGNVLMVMIS